MSAIDAATREACRAAIGRSRSLTDSMAPEAAQRLAVVLGRPLAGEELPPTWHWAYFHAGIPAADQGEDLHERLGLFLPPLPLPRRMWASGAVQVHRPLRLGRPARQTVTIADVAFKEGRSGALAFVTLHHAIDQDGARAIDEERTLVYRDRGGDAPRLTPDPLPAPLPEPRRYDDGTLFFYSAITHNGHRIHWDRDFCRRVEGYPDLVVHGPLLATDLCDALLPAPAPCRYVYRALAPVFAGIPVRLVTEGAGQARMIRPDGVTAMEARLA